MRRTFMRAAAAVLTAVVVSGAGTESRAQYTRRTPIVEAVRKTHKGIISLKVLKSGDFGSKEIVGTGVIVDERGYAITNHHVATRASRVRVQLHDRTTCNAQVVLTDPRYDLAILRLPTRKKLQALSFGPGSDLLVGETVIAVGHPFGYTNTVSTGIISALGREITMPTGETLRNLIQTNASINPGNSGGPLLNINGELIGINVAIRDGAQGIAFALNADTVKEFLSRHLSARKMARLGHGLSCREEVRGEGAGRQKVVVAGVAERSPAARAGLRPGDVIVRVADRSVVNRFDVERALWDCKAGEQVRTTVVRDGKETTVALTLGGGQPAAARVSALSRRSPRSH
jgi:serine protease Do